MDDRVVMGTGSGEDCGICDCEREIDTSAQQTSTRRGRGVPRENSGGARAGSGGPRDGAGAARAGAGGRRSGAGGPRDGAGGPRDGAGGPRQNSGGPRSGAGGAREGAGGHRAGAGRPRRTLLSGPAYTVTAYAGHNPEGSASGVTPGNASGAEENAAGGPNNFPPNEPVVEDGDGNVHDPLDMGADGGAGDGGGAVPHDALNFEEEMAHLDGVDNQHEGYGQAPDDGNAAEIQQVHQQQPVPPDPVFVLEAASPRQGVFPLLYAWDAAAHAACNSPDYAAPPRLGNSCSNCGEVGHCRNHCALPSTPCP
jgi:hypothetical protein